jgi:DNA topoisomerase 2-associated protein PAT1
MLTMLTLLVACFSQLDVVTDATILYDTSEATDTFLATVMHTMMLVVAKITLTPISGLLELLMKHNDIMTICHTRVRTSGLFSLASLLIECDLSR